MYPKTASQKGTITVYSEYSYPEGVQNEMRADKNVQQSIENRPKANVFCPSYDFFSPVNWDKKEWIGGKGATVNVLRVLILKANSKSKEE